MEFPVFAAVSYLLMATVGFGTADDRLIIKLLRMDEENFRISPDDFPLRSGMAQGFIDDLAKLNLKEAFMEEIWRVLLLTDSPNKMSRNDWVPYEKIIGTLPQHFIYELNISDPEILDYFGKLEVLNNRQLATFGDKLKNTFGTYLLEDKDMILKLGNLLCGFTGEDLKKISPENFRALLGQELFKSISGCGMKQLRGLLNVAFKYTAIGPPATWTTYTISSIGYLLAGLNADEIQQIRDESCSGIGPHVISAVPENVLSNMRPNQVASLERSSKLAWRRKTKNTKYYSSGADSIFYASLFLVPALLQPVQFLLIL